MLNFHILPTRQLLFQPEGPEGRNHEKKTQIFESVVKYVDASTRQIGDWAQAGSPGCPAILGLTVLNKSFARISAFGLVSNLVVDAST